MTQSTALTQSQAAENSQIQAIDPSKKVDGLPSREIHDDQFIDENLRLTIPRKKTEILARLGLLEKIQSLPPCGVEKASKLVWGILNRKPQGVNDFEREKGAIADAIEWVSRLSQPMAKKVLMIDHEVNKFIPDRQGLKKIQGKIAVDFVIEIKELKAALCLIERIEREDQAKAEKDKIADEKSKQESAAAAEWREMVKPILTDDNKLQVAIAIAGNCKSAMIAAMAVGIDYFNDHQKRDFLLKATPNCPPTRIHELLEENQQPERLTA